MNKIIPKERENSSNALLKPQISYYMTRTMLGTLNLSLVGSLRLHQNDICAVKERKIAQKI